MTKMVIRRRLGNATALKRLYVPLDSASSFMPPLQSWSVDAELREDKKRRKKGEREEEISRTRGAGTAGASAGPKETASRVSRTTVTFAFIPWNPSSGDTDRSSSDVGGGIPKMSNSEGFATTTLDVEYERRHFGDQVHHCLTKGWKALSLMLGARVGDTLEMSRYYDEDRRNFRVEDGDACEEAVGASAAEHDGLAAAAAAATCSASAAASADAGRGLVIFIRIVE